MNVSIIYVNYKTAALVIDSIRSVREHTSGVDYEILVVDNGSADGSAGQIRQACPEAKLIEAGANLGFGRANNLGLEHASGETIFFLNPDTRLQNNAVRILYNYLAADKKAGACGGNLVDAEGRPACSFGRSFPSFWQEFLSIFYLEPVHRRHSRSTSYNYTGRPLPVASLVGADLLVKRSVLDKTGGFSPDFFMYFEETELCRRIRKAGYRVVSVPEARIVHLEGQAPHITATRMQRFFEGQYVFFSKRYGSWGPGALYGLLTLKCALRTWQFMLLGYDDRLAYWRTKAAANRQVYRDYRESRAHGKHEKHKKYGKCGKTGKNNVPEQTSVHYAPTCDITRSAGGGTQEQTAAAAPSAQAPGRLETTPEK